MWNKHFRIHACMSVGFLCGKCRFILHGSNLIRQMSTPLNSATWTSNDKKTAAAWCAAALRYGKLTHLWWVRANSGDLFIHRIKPRILHWSIDYPVKRSPWKDHKADQQTAEGTNCATNFQIPRHPFCQGMIGVSNHPLNIQLFTRFYRSQIAGFLNHQQHPPGNLTYPPDKACLKMICLFPRWDSC